MMEDRRRRSTIRSTLPKLEDRQSPTSDDQTHGAEDGDQRALTHDDHYHGAEDAKSAGANAHFQKHGADDGGPAATDDSTPHPTPPNPTYDPA